MSIVPVSSIGTPQPTNTEPQTQPTRSIRDSLSSHPDSATVAPIQIKTRSPLAIVCDFLECIRYFIVSQMQKVQFFFISCISNITKSRSRPIPQKPSTAPVVNPSPPHVRTSAATVSLPDSAAGAFIPEATPNTASQEDGAFRALPIADADKANIRFIINTLATVIALPAMELEKRGDEIRHIHPFTFWEFVLTEPSLIENIKALKSRYFGLIWGQFTGGCIEKLEAMDNQGLLAPHVNAFARSIRRDPEDLRTLMRTSWLYFLNNLVDVSGQTPLLTGRMTSCIPADRASDSGDSTESSQGSSLSQPPADHPAAGLHLTLPTDNQRLNSAAFSPQGYTTGRATAESMVITIPMDQEQIQKLNRLLTDISGNSPLILAFQLASLKNDWHALQEVHPLRLLWEVFDNPAHIAKVDLILNNSLKKGYFLADFSNTLKASGRGKELRPYFHDFGRKMGVGQEILERIIVGSHDEWRYLIRYLHTLKRAAARDATFTS